MTGLNSTLSLPRSVPDTSLPFFDTLYREFRSQGSKTDARSNGNPSTPNRESDGWYLEDHVRKPSPEGEQSILQAYARFISALTGQDEVAFHFRPHNQIYHAKILASSGISKTIFQKPVSWQTVDTASITDAALDFSIHVGKYTGKSLNGFTNDTPFVVGVDITTDSSICVISIQVAQDRASLEDVSHMLQNFIQYLRYSIAEERFTPEESYHMTVGQSILNFPPLCGPPPFPQDTTQTPVRDALLHRAFERRAAEHPKRTALEYLRSIASQSKASLRETYTYGDLNRLADGLANILLEEIGSGANSGTRVVPVLLSTSPELYISYLAILKSGLAFCPLPIDAPTQRLQDIIDDLNPQVLLGAASSREQYSSLTLRSSFLKSWIDVEEFVYRNTSVNGEERIPLKPSVDPRQNDVCYVMYTSGSTGKPKGVQITHLAATSSIASHAQLQLPPSKDGLPRWFQFAAPTFDPSLMEIFVTLSTGATLCSASRHLTLSDLEGTVSMLSASIMMSTPSMAALLRPSKMPSLRSLWTMGETLLRRNIEDFASNPSNTNLCNAYGPTEAAINCTLLPNFHPEDRGSIIGPVLPTCSLFVIDASSTEILPVPRGFVGELAIGGPQVSIGYLNRPEQNLKSFVESPEFGRLYRTGDKGRIVTDRKGQFVVEFLGRLDDSQVKLSGRRVDLREIDTILAKCCGVQEAVTILRKRFEDQHGSEEAIVFIVLHECDQRTAETECREAAARHLPPYMCPTDYFFVENIPRSSSGKVDRKALARLVDSPRRVEARETPLDEEAITDTPNDKIDKIELLLSGLLSEVLGGAQVGLTTNLFSVGMDSLRAVRFLQLLRDSGIDELGIVDVLRNATPRSLADILLERRTLPHANSNGASPNICPLPPRFDKDAFYQRYQSTCADHFGINIKDIKMIMPTTATQSGMLASFLRSCSGAGSPKRNYIHHSVHHINPSVNLRKLQRCWTTVLERHDAYRIVFLPVDDTSAPFLQCVLNTSCHQATKAWKVYLLDEDDDETFQRTIQMALLEAEKNISLDRPPFQLALVGSPTRTAVTCSLFHAIFDGASLQLLFEEVTGEYLGVPTPPRTEISTAVDMHFTSEAPDTIRFWTVQMEHCEPVPFPSLTGLRPEARSKAPKTTTHSATVTLNSLRGGAANVASSPLAVLQAAWSLLLITYKDSWDSSTFGSVVSGRLDSDSELCIGPTFTTIPVTIPANFFQAKPDTSSAEVLRYLTELNAKALEHLQIPLNSVVAPGGGLYYDTLLAYQDFASGRNSSSLWHSVEYPAMGNDFSVMIEVWPEPDGTLLFRATYTDEHLDEQSASLMLHQFDDVIVSIIQDPEQPLSNDHFATPPALPSVELAPLMSELDRLLHGPFEYHARQKPDDIALIFKKDLQLIHGEGNIQWTYRELDHKANCLAGYLTQTFGCLRDTVVPFSLEKSPELYVAILGILKAGAAWCPIDPAFPADRRHTLISRTGATMLLVANTSLVQEPTVIPDGVVIIDIRSAEIENTSAIIDESLSPRQHDMAYLIWTSGTTGLPKGVMVEHQSAATAMKSLRDLIRTSNEGTVRCLQFSQPTFDVFIQDLFYTWGLGGTVISATKDIMLGSFAALANQTMATHAHLTPAFAAVCPRDQIKTLQVVTFIGEALPQPIADDWSQSMVAYNTYGPAEVSVVSTVRQFAGCSNNFKSSNIGYNLPSVLAFVINDEKTVVRQGVGELALAGPQVARGYWKDSAKTSEKFLWNESAQAHVYMTGDIVRQLHDGSFEFVGRRDDLVKLNGMRVELSEISFALQHCHPDVEQVVTMYMARPDRPTKVVIAFLSVPSWQEKAVEYSTPIIHSVASGLTNAALSKARMTLPEHMIPSVIIVLSSIPITASAKIDRNALSKAYENLDIETWEKMIFPAQSNPTDWTAEEAALLEEISSFSGIVLTSMSRASRLAGLGIDSIGAIRLAARLKAVGYSISTADLLQSRTIGGLCEELKRLSSETSSEKTTSRLQEFHKKWYPAVSEYLKFDSEASFFICPALQLQENLLSETFRNPQRYWSNHFFQLAKSVDATKLKNAWKAVASQNDALRVGFVQTAAITADLSAQKAISTFLQVIYKEPVIDFAVIGLPSEEDTVRAKQRAWDIALKHQKSSFLRPCWAVTIFERDESHTMMFSIHHSIHDGVSLSFVMKDLEVAYTTMVAPERRQLREAVILSMLSTTHDVVDDATFWEETLKDFVSVEDDIGDGKGAPKSSSGYHTATIPLSTSYSDLQAFMQQYGCLSITSILRAVWGCTIVDVLETSNKNIVLGEVLSERALHPSLDNVIGPLVTLVPAPVGTSGSSREIVQKHDKMMNTVWKHRNISPGALRRLIKRPKDQSLYPAVFVFHPYTGESRDNSLWTEVEDTIGLNVEHDLTLNIEERSDGSLDLVVSAEVSVLTLDGVQLLTKQVDALITAMVKYPNESLPELTNHFPIELLSKTRLRSLPVNNIVAYENPLCWFEHWAEVAPDWPAAEIAEHIGDGTTQTVSLSFSKLNKESNLVSAFIQSLDIHGRTIGMCLGRTLAAFAITLGIFKSGNTYLPIDEDLPIERKAFLLRDSNTALFFTRGQADFTPPGCKVLDIDTSQYKVDIPSFNDVSRSKDDIAYLLYTSGSTGNPKGVLVSCQNLTAFCEAQSEFICANAPATLELGGTGKWLGLASRAFDVHVAEMFLAWRHGLCAVTGKRSMLLDDLTIALKELKVTHASFVPSLLDQVGLVPADVPLLRFMSVGGEKISQRTLEAWGDSDTVPLVNAYGPTECTIGCCSARVSSKSNMRNIGNPLGDMVAHVLLPGTLTYAKRGMEGELCFTGTLVGIGYHNHDSGAFVEDFHGAKMYRTGDLVRMMPDGSIEIFGRSDDQTKIRGQRLELGEVSECVRSLSPKGAYVASLIAKYPELSRMQLVSFVAQSRSGSGSESPTVLQTFDEVNDTIRAGCKERLPSYMVPDVVVPLSFLPLAATSGKADVKLLKSIFSSIPLGTLLSVQGPSNPTTHVKQRELNEKEKQIAVLLRVVLAGTPPDIQPSTNIFEIGVDSLVSISLATLMRKHGYDCSVSDVLGTDTVADLALLPHTSTSQEQELASRACVQQNLSKFEAAFRQSAIGVKLVGKVASVRPCLPVQEAVVAKSLDKDGTNTYVNHIVWELSSYIDTSKFQQAWELSIRDNEILRTCFCQIGNDILQTVLHEDAFEILWNDVHSDQVDYLGLLKGMQDDIARNIVNAIDTTPPMRLHLLRTNSSIPSLFCISIHHALYDAESLVLLFNHVYSRYKGLEISPRPSSEPLIEHIISIDETASQAYWTGALQGYRCPPLQTEIQTDIAAKIRTRPLKSSLTFLEAKAASLRVTLPTLAQTAFGIGMAKASSVNDFVFGLVLSGRSIPIPGAENILAPTIATVPQRVDLRESKASVRDVLTAVQKSSGKMLQFQHTSLRAIHRWAKADYPLFNCLSSFVRHGKQPSYDDVWTEVESYMPPDYPFSIEFEANVESNELIIRAGYTSNFGSDQDVESVLEMIELLIDAISTDSAMTVKSFGIESKEQIQPASTSSDGCQEFSSQELQIKNILLEFGEFESHYISRHSTFFRLGVDSVIAIRFAQRLRAAGLKVSSSDIARHPSIAQLCDHISSNNQVSIQPPLISTTVSSYGIDHYRNMIPLLSTNDKISQLYLCTPLQTGLLTQTVASGGTLYVHHPAVQLVNSVDLGRLRSAWATVVASLDILRISFHYVEESETRWIAAVHEHPQLDWSDISVYNVEESVRNVIAATVFPNPKSFSSPPIKVTILKSTQKRVMVLSLHHSLYDGWSLPLIFDYLYAAYTSNQIPPTTPFSTAAKLIMERQQGSVDFWLKRLDNYTAVKLSDSVNTTTFSKITIGMVTTNALDKCKALDVNLQSVALLAYGKALCCLVQRRDIVFGHVVSGRTLPVEDAEQIVGPLFNTVPFRVRLDNVLLTNEDVVRQVQSIVVDGQEYQHASLNRIQKIWRQSQNGSEDALLDALFVFQRAAAADAAATDSVWTQFEMEHDRDSTEYGLNVEFDQGESELIFSTSSSCLSPKDLEEFCQTFDRSFQDILKTPLRSVTAYPENLHTLPTTTHKKLLSSQAVNFDDVIDNSAISVVRGAFSDVSQVPADLIMLETSIFSLGIDSIAAIRVASICRERGTQLSVADILQGRCIGGIVQILILKDSKPSRYGATLPTKVSLEIEKSILARLKHPESKVEQILPCLAGQIYHLASWLNSSRTFYEPTWALRSRTRIDAIALCSAWCSLQRRHAILRTLFVNVGSYEVYQIVLQPDSFDDNSFSVLKTSEDLVEVVKREVRTAYASPSALLDPPISLRLIQGATEDSVLIKLHHSLYDAWTMTSLISELSDLYSERPSISIPSFPDFVWHTRHNLAQLEESSFWASTLANMQRTILPPSNPKTAASSPHKQIFIWFRGAVTGLKSKTDICQSSGLAFTTVVIQAFARVLSRYTRTSHPTFGFFHTGRSASFTDTARVPGPCVNLLPLSIPSEGKSDLDIALQIQDELSKRVPFEQSYLRDIICWKEGLDPQSSDSYPQPLFNASLNLLWSSKHQTEKIDERDKLLEPMDIGVPTNFISEEAILGESAVDGLETGYLAKQNLFMDVGPVEETDSVDFGVKCDYALMDEGELRVFVAAIAREIESIVGGLTVG